MTQHNHIAIILLAAGASSRMQGRDKLLEEVFDRPLLRRVAEAASDSMAEKIIVVLGAYADERRKALAALPLQYAVNEDWKTGMASSIRTGVDALSTDTEAALILLGDMPEVGKNVIDALITSFDPEQGKDIVRPVSGSGVGGNPILFGKRHFPALKALTGDIGAKPVIKANPDSVLDVPTKTDGVLIDLDTPEAWAAWRARQ